MLTNLCKMLLNKLFLNKGFLEDHHRSRYAKDAHPKQYPFIWGHFPLNQGIHAISNFGSRFQHFFLPFSVLSFFLSSLFLASDVHVHHLRWQPLHFRSQHHRDPPGPATWPRAAWGLPGAGRIPRAVGQWVDGGHATPGDEAGEADAARAGGDPTPPQKKHEVHGRVVKPPTNSSQMIFFEFSY